MTWPSSESSNHIAFSSLYRQICSDFLPRASLGLRPDDNLPRDRVAAIGFLALFLLVSLIPFIESACVRVQDAVPGPQLHRDQLRLLRAPSDEASLALATAQGIGWLSSRLWGFFRRHSEL